MLKYNLLITASTFPNSEQDTEPRFVYDLALNLLNDFHITVLVPASPKAALKENMNGINVIRYRYAPFRWMETLTYPGAILPRIKEKPIRALLVPFLLCGLYCAIKKELREKKYHCVHAHWFFPQGMIQLFFRDRRKYPPYMVTGHGGDIFGLNNLFCNKIKKQVALNAIAVTAVSNALKTRIDEISENKVIVHVIPMGTNTNTFSPTKKIDDLYKTELGLHGVIILFVGRLVEKKGVTYLLDAMDHPIIKQTNVHLVIIGNGPLKKELEQKRITLKLENSVTFLDSLPHETIATFYASADIFCAPSIVANDGDTEGFGLVIVEALASGIPVVSSRIAGIIDIITEGEVGLLVEQKQSGQIAEALYKLITNYELRMYMSKNAATAANQFSLKSSAKKYHQLVLNIIQNKG